jgi:hypothetical protein
MMVVRLLPFGLLLAYGIAFGGVTFGWALPAFDDHPGQFYRLWHVIVRGPAPWAWNPDWWAGYPELQFYPPGFFYLGALLHGIWSLGGSHATWPRDAYCALLWLTYLAPGVTSFALLSHLLRGGWAAFPGAFIALTLSAGVASGVEGGVHIGMLPARLGWALLPLLALALLRGLDRDGTRPWLIAPIVGAIALVHPAHVPAALVIVALAAWAGAGARSRRLASSAGVLVLAAGFTLFWSLPLLARLDNTRALAWGSLPGPTALVSRPLLLLLLLLAALTPRMARTPGERIVARWAWAMIAVVAAVAVIEPLGMSWLPAARIADSAWLAVVLAAGFVIGRGVEAMAMRTRLPVAASALIIVGVAVILSLPGGTLTIRLRAVDWPTLESVERGLRLGDLWTAIRDAPAGRVLFLRSSVPLVFGTEWWRPHSHVTALTPIRTALSPRPGREIINGTFTHPSPVAAFVYRGSSARGAVRRLVEELDGDSLFGRPLATLDPATVDRSGNRLGISAIVALDEDAPRLRVFDDNPAFERRAPLGPFVLFVRRQPMALPQPIASARWRLALAAAPAGWVSTRIAYYPLWHAERNGAELPTRRGEAGDLEVWYDGAESVAELVYAPGIPEWLGARLSLGSVMVWLVLGGWSSLARRAQRQREDSADSRTEARTTPATS